MGLVVRFVSSMTPLSSLKAMGFEPSGPFITSILELKLDSSSGRRQVRKFRVSLTTAKLLDFLNLHAQASEASANDVKKTAPHFG